MPDPTLSCHDLHRLACELEAERDRLQQALDDANTRFHAMNTPTGREIELQAERDRLLAYVRKQATCPVCGGVEANNGDCTFCIGVFRSRIITEARKFLNGASK